MSIKSILYDLDGTLIDMVSTHYDALNMALQEVSNTFIDKSEEAIFNGLPTSVKLDKLVTMGRVNEADKHKIWTMKQEYTKDAIKKNITSDPVKIELHEYTKSLGIKSVCVTNSITETAQLMLECSGQWGHMDFLISNDDVKRPKPHGEGYIKAMIRLGTFPEENIIVEDSPYGVEAAMAAGCHLFKIDGQDDLTKDSMIKFIEDIGV